MSTEPTAPARLEIVDKADAILHTLADAGEASAVEIAEATGEPTSSTYRLLAGLLALGWVEKGSRRGAHRLGVDMLRIGSIVEDRLDVRGVALPELRTLLEATGATAFLLVRAGDRGVCVERLEGTAVRSLALTLGHSLPLHQGAAPRAILAFLPTAEREVLLDGLLAQDPTAPSRSEVEATLTRVREEGLSVSDEDVTPGVAAVGAPLFGHRGEVVAAISVSGLRGSVLDPDIDAAGLVRDAARRASAALGFTGEEKDDADR